jgi:hypothetical protein
MGNFSVEQHDFVTVYIALNNIAALTQPSPKSKALSSCGSREERPERCGPILWRRHLLLHSSGTRQIGAPATMSRRALTTATISRNTKFGPVSWGSILRDRYDIPTSMTSEETWQSVPNE